jgi:hypothetical protein
VDYENALTIWSARFSAVLYGVAVVLLSAGHGQRARLAATAGLSVYLLHVWAAFEYAYDWSHTRAYVETARQTAELYGLCWGGGLYLNYLFTGVWVGDCVWWWRQSEARYKRARAVTIAVHGFLIFMFVNATFVVWVLRAIR